MTRKILFFIIILAVLVGVTAYFYYSYQQEKESVLPEKQVKENIVSESSKQPEAPEPLNYNSLLIQIDKTNCLPREYVPKDLINILDYQIPASLNFKLREIAISDLKDMINEASQQGIELRVISAYRSYDDQKRIYNSWVSKLGRSEANRQSAPAGCSQHQLGTAVDFNKLDSNFANEPAGIWLLENGHKYGWVISYPKNSENLTGYIYEPWHYRYIGIENAQEFKKSGLILSQFLDLKQ